MERILLSLDHVQLAMPARQEDAARAFFVGVLGMAEEEKPEPLRVRGGVWFRAGSVVVHCGVDEPFAPQRKAHPAFCVENLDALAERMSAAGVSVLWDETLPGRRRFYASDPFGNRMEFLATGDGFSGRTA